MQVSDEFYRRVLADTGAPITMENLRACHAWQRAEGGRAQWNPFNTTQDEPGASPYNSFGPGGKYHVMNYRSELDGIRATVTTMKNGHYARILDAFKRGSDGHAVCTAVDASVWGTHGAAHTYLTLYGPGHVVSARRVLRFQKPMLHGSDVRLVQERLHAAGFTPNAFDSFYGPNTAAEVERFQRAHHLSVDGVVGPRTYVALGIH